MNAATARGSGTRKGRARCPPPVVRAGRRGRESNPRAVLGGAPPPATVRASPCRSSVPRPLGPRRWRPSHAGVMRLTHGVLAEKSMHWGAPRSSAATEPAFAAKARGRAVLESGRLNFSASTGVLPGRAIRRAQLLDARGGGDAGEGRAVLAVVVAEQVARPLAER